jgi:hypothetical protein
MSIVTECLHYAITTYRYGQSDVTLPIQQYTKTVQADICAYMKAIGGHERSDGYWTMAGDVRGIMRLIQQTNEEIIPPIGYNYAPLTRVMCEKLTASLSGRVLVMFGGEGDIVDYLLLTTEPIRAMALACQNVHLHCDNAFQRRILQAKGYTCEHSGTYDFVIVGQIDTPIATLTQQALDYGREVRVVSSPWQSTVGIYPVHRETITGNYSFYRIETGVQAATVEAVKPVQMALW